MAPILSAQEACLSIRPALIAHPSFQPGICHDVPVLFKISRHGIAVIQPCFLYQFHIALRQAGVIAVYMVYPSRCLQRNSLHRPYSLTAW